MPSSLADHLLFFAGGHRYAVPVEKVDRIAEELSVSPLPGTPPFLRGAANIHGRIAAVVDLAAFLACGTASRNGTLLLLNIPDAALALLIDQTERIFHEEDIIAVNPVDDPLASATLCLADGTALLLLPDRLLASIEQALA
jgi:chemotaxis signal transduction protein